MAFTFEAVFLVASIVISHRSPHFQFAFSFFCLFVVVLRQLIFAFLFGGFGGFVPESLRQPEGFAQRRFGAGADRFGL